MFLNSKISKKGFLSAIRNSFLVKLLSTGIARASSHSAKWKV